MAITKSKFHNISLKELLDKLISTHYRYSIEQEDGVWTLNIHTTPMSEMDTEDEPDCFELSSEGVIQDFSYMEKKEAEEDLQTAIKEYDKIWFEEEA